MLVYRTAFISHAHADNVRCASIAAHLKARGIDVWIDLSNLQTGHALGADASPWVGNELDTYLAYSLDRSMWMVGGQQRLIIPVRLAPVTIQPDAEVSNWAKVFGRKWIDGVGKPDAQVADEIAAALLIADAPIITDRRDPPPPSDNGWDDIPTPVTLYRLGFQGKRVRATGVEFILPPTCDVAAGAFDMGSADSDKQAYDDEKPQYRISIGAFAIGKYPVTVAEYACYLKANPGVAVPEGKDDDFYGWKQQQARPDHPVVLVTWFNARDYAAWLPKPTGQHWRLPTEAEWEKAARWDEAKQHARIYPWGDTWDKTRANTSDGGPGRTTPAGSYPSDESPYHAQDMAGNVWEWTSSLSNPYPYNPAVSEDLGNRTSARVLRGGSWISVPRNARAACRDRNNPNNSNNRRGFRLSRGAGDDTGGLASKLAHAARPSCGNDRRGHHTLCQCGCPLAEVRDGARDAGAASEIQNHSARRATV